MNILNGDRAALPFIWRIRAWRGCVSVHCDVCSTLPAHTTTLNSSMYNSSSYPLSPPSPPSHRQISPSISRLNQISIENSAGGGWFLGPGYSEVACIMYGSVKQLQWALLQTWETSKVLAGCLADWLVTISRHGIATKQQLQLSER